MADFSTEDQGFPDHTTASPPVAGPTSVAGGSLGAIEGRWELSYDTTPGTDSSANEFSVNSGVLRNQDWGGTGRFESVSIDVSGLTSVDITALGETVGGAVQNGASEFFEYFYTLDGGADVVTDISLTGDSAGTPVNFDINGLDVSGASTLTVGFSFNANGGGDGYEISSFEVDTASGVADSSFVLINEVLFDVPGLDPTSEYLEFRGDAGTQVPAGTYLLNIEGDSDSGFGPGKVSNIFDLSGLAFGSNGYLVLSQAGSGYTIDPAANSLVSSTSDFGGLSFFSSDVAANEVENATNSFLLVSSSTTPILDDDVDDDNDGVLDGTLATSWTLLDSIGVSDGGGADFVYADVDFTITGNSGYVGRLGTSTGFTAADWVSSELGGALPNYSLATGTATPASLDGAALDHIGSDNTDVTVVASGDFAINEIRISHITNDNASNNFIELAEVNGASGVSTDGLTLVVLQGVAFDSATAGDIALTFDLTGGSSDGKGFTLLHDDGSTATLSPGDLEFADLDLPGAPFTYLLVDGFTGASGDVLDTDDDGVLDVTPWGTVYDAVSVDSSGGTAIHYATSDPSLAGVTVFSADGFVPSAIAREPDITGAFTVGSFSDDSTDTPGSTNVPLFTLTESGSLTAIEEGGVTDTVEIVLTSAPTADVTFTFTPEDSQFTVSPLTLTFTPGNFATPQSVTLTADDDALLEGSHFRDLTITSASTDTAFDALEVPAVNVAIVDNDGTIPDVVINEVRIDFDGALDSTNNFVEIYETSGAAVDVSGLTVVVISEEFNPGQIDFAIPLSGGMTDANGFALLLDDGSLVTPDPGDIVANFDFFGSPSTILLVAGFTGSAGTDLDPGDDGTLDLVPWSQVIDAVTLEELPGTFQYGNTFSQSVASGTTDVTPGVRRVVDGTGEFLALDVADESGDTPGATNALPANVRVTTGDTTLLEKTTVDFNGQVGVSTITFDVTLDSAPTGDVTITVTPDAQVELAGGSPTVDLTFTSANWFTPQTVTVNAIDDAVDEGDHTGLVSFTASSTDTNYDAITVADLATDIIDNDNANHVVVINEYLYDPGTAEDANGDGTANSIQDEFVEILNTGSTAIDISGWVISDAIAVRHEFATGTVLAGGQAIVVFGGGTLGTYGNSLSDVATVGGSPTGNLSLNNGGDTVSLSDGTRTIDLDAYVSGEVNDESLARDPDGTGPFSPTTVFFDIFGPVTFSTPGTVNFDGSDFPLSAGVLITESGGSTAVAEDGATSDTFEIVLTGMPSAAVTVDVIVADGETTVSPTQLTFTAADFATPQTVTVTAVDDADVEGSHTGQVAFTLSSSDTAYDALAVPDVAVTIADDDTPAAPTAVINEFVLDHAGGDVDAFVEIFAPGVTAATDLSGLTLLEIEGGTAFGTIDDVFTLGTTDAAGFYVENFDAENDTVTLLLVSGFTGAAGDDLDTDDDGVFDVTPWTAIVDSVATVEDTATDIAYSAVALTPGLDGNAFQFGGASRIPDGTDTDTTADWVRNNFAGEGLPSFPGAVAAAGEAVNTPGLPNVVSTGTPGVTVDDDGGVDLDETGPTSDTFDVVLDAEPTADVTITVSVVDGETTIDLTTLTFTTADWDTPQTVTVTAVDDSDIEGNHTGLVSFSVASSDADYSALTVPDLTVSIVDNDGASGLAPGDLVINEILQNPSAAGDGFGEFVELWNTTGADIDIDGFVLSDDDFDSHTIVNGAPLIVPAGGFLVLGINSDAAVNGGNNAAYQYSGFTLSNGADEVIISDNFGLVIDEVFYDGGPAFPDPNGASMELIPGLTDPHLANDSGANWQAGTVVFGDGDLGTPGTVNTTIVTDTTGPTVVDVIVTSSTWTGAFIDIVDGGGVGAGNGLGLSLPGADQLRNLPWLSGIDTIYVQFSEDVSASFTAANLSLLGSNTPNYEPFSSLVYGTAGTDIGTINLASAVTNDTLLLTVFDSLTDAAGNALDGEWVDSVSTISGDATAGGQFDFRLDILAGDADGSGAVNLGGDVLGIFGQNGALPTDVAGAYFDVDASGAVNLGGDVLGTFALNGSLLPATPPLPPLSSSAFNSGAVDSVMGSLDEEELGLLDLGMLF